MKMHQVNGNDNMEYAPVIIPTLSRYEHLKNCISSLRACTDASKTDLYISVDYPPSQKHVEGHKKVVEYLKGGISGFSSVNVFYQEKNLGMNENGLFLIDSIRKDHTCFIYSEDDNEFSPNFLVFINKGLRFYQDRDDVIAISGYSYPIEFECKGNTYTNPVYFSYHGCGMKVDDFYKMTGDINLKWLMGLYRNTEKMNSLIRTSRNQYCNLVKSVLGYILPIINGNEVRPADIVCGIYLFDKGYRMAYPTESKVINRGYDGSGEDCMELVFDESKPLNHRNYPYDKQPIDKETVFDEVIEENIENEKLYEYFDKFFLINNKELNRTKIAYMFSRIFGISFTKKILSGK